MGVLTGPGYRQETPLKVRLTCPTRLTPSEILFPQDYIMAKMNAKMRAGMRAITKRHVDLLQPVQLVPGRWTHAHVNVPGQDQTTSPAFELTVDLSSALNLGPEHLNEMTPQASAELLLNLNIPQDMRQQIERTVHHCAMANACLGSAQADFIWVRFRRTSERGT